MKGGLSEVLAYLETCPTKQQFMARYPSMAFRYPNKVAAYLESARVKRDRAQAGIFNWPDAEQLEPVSKLIFRALYQAVHDRRELRAKNIYIYGPPGTGKTTFWYYVSRYFPVYFAPLDEQFFDLFDHEYKVVVFDEFNSTLPITWLNAFCTGHPLSIRKKGAQMLKRTNPLTVVLSNLPIEQQYKNIQVHKPELFQAFCDRFDVIALTDDYSLHHCCDLIQPPSKNSEFVNPYE